MGATNPSTPCSQPVEQTIRDSNLKQTVQNAVLDEFDSIREIEQTAPETLAERVNKRLRDTDENEPLSNTSFPWLTAKTVSLLDDMGVTTLYELADLDIEDVPDDDKFDDYKGQIRTANTHARQEIIRISEQRAKTLQEEILASLPSGPQIARNRIERLENLQQKGELDGTATKLDGQGQLPDNPPVALANDYSDSVGPEYREDTQFMVDTGDGNTDPIPTGFQVLDNDEYRQIPEPGEQLPVNSSGDVVKPAPATDPKKDMQVLTYMGKKLGRNQPVLAIGDRGVGKDFRFKYIAWRTNRGHRLIDCAEEMKTEHLFGTLSPNEDGVVVVRDGQLKQGLLNPDITVLSEFTSLSSNVMSKLHGLLEEGEVLIEYQNEYVKPHPASRIGATANPGDKLEYRHAESPSTATQARFRPVFVTAPDSKAAEHAAIKAQVASNAAMVSSQVIKKIVEFARKTRKDTNEDWPTLSPRNVKNVCIDIADGVQPFYAAKSEIQYLGHQHMKTDDAVESLRTHFGS